MNKISNILWGLVLIALGVVFGLNALEITDIDIFFDGWWTLIIIVPCFIGLITGESIIGNLIGAIVGLCLLFACQGLLDFAILWKLLVPAILVIIGLSIIFKDTFNNKIRKEINKISKEKGTEYAAVFSGQNLDFSKEEFKGSTLDAVFGGIKCDLRDATIKKDAVITTSNIFGGTTIHVPDDVNIKIVSNSIFGGVSDERKKKTTDAKITIYINATCIFGGVEIK